MPVTIAPREHRKALAARTSGKPSLGIVQFLGEVRGRSDLLSPARFRGRVEDGWLDTILSDRMGIIPIVPNGTERQNHLAKEVRDSWHNIE